MAYKHLQPLDKKLVIVVGLTVVGFMALSLAASYYQNFLFEQTLQNLEDKNSDLQDVIASGYRELEYYRSTQYRDRYAKENLGKLNPGENVLIITKSSGPLVETNEQDELIRQEQREAAYLELLRQMPVSEHWKLYLFNRDQMEAIRESYLEI